MTPRGNLELLPGTLDIMILRALAGGPCHGYAISRWIRSASEEDIGLEDRTLYVALHRLEAAGLIRGSAAVTGSGRTARRYSLTASGRRHLERSIARWTQYVQAMGRLLRSTAPARAT